MSGSQTNEPREMNAPWSGKGSEPQGAHTKEVIKASDQASDFSASIDIGEGC